MLWAVSRRKALGCRRFGADAYGPLLACLPAQRLLGEQMWVRGLGSGRAALGVLVGSLGAPKG